MLREASAPESVFEGIFGSEHVRHLGRKVRAAVTAHGNRSTN